MRIDLERLACFAVDDEITAENLRREKTDVQRELMAEYEEIQAKINAGPFAQMFTDVYTLFRFLPEEFICAELDRGKELGLSVIESEEIARNQLKSWQKTLEVIERAVSLHDRAKQSKGGQNKKKLTDDIHRQWLREELENFKGSAAIYDKIKAALFNKHGYKVSSKIIRDRVREYNLLEDA